MKKILLTLLLILPFFGIVSCSGSDDDKAQQITQKLENGESLDENEYDFCAKYVINAQKEYLRLIKGAKSVGDVEKAAITMTENYPYADDFLLIISKENVSPKLWNEIEEFQGQYEKITTEILEAEIKNIIESTESSRK